MPINLFNILNGVAGAKPPAGTRGGSPSNIPPARMPGVYAWLALHDAEPTKHTQPFTTGKGFGVRDREYMISHKFRLISINRTQLCILWYSNYDRI